MGISVLDLTPRYLMAPLQYSLVKLEGTVNIKVVSLLPAISFCTSPYSRILAFCPLTVYKFPSNKKPP